MFFDSQAWPPPPDGFEPKPPPPQLSKRDEKILSVAVGLFLVTLFLAPLAGSSVIAAIIALF